MVVEWEVYRVASLASDDFPGGPSLTPILADYFQRNYAFR